MKIFYKISVFVLFFARHMYKVNLESLLGNVWKFVSGW